MVPRLPVGYRIYESTRELGSSTPRTAIGVDGAQARGTIVALGDSITDGWQSTFDANRRWPDPACGALR
jgi:lysophospholipase L1-like esterase